MTALFDVPVFFVVFRETLEIAVVVSVLLAVVEQSAVDEEGREVQKKLRNQIWLGVTIGSSICLVLGGSLVGIFYILGTDKWSESEYLWEGFFGLIASIIITIMGGSMLRISKLKSKWRNKFSGKLDRKNFNSRNLGERFQIWYEENVLILLPLITVLREGIEAIVFVGGVSMGTPKESIPIPTILGLAAGSVVGVLIFKGGNFAPLKLFLVVTTCFLYHFAAGLFSRAIWYFEADNWNRITGGDAAETGSGPGSYDIRRSVWHVNCCNPELNGGGWWGVFNSLLGWQNSATYGSVIGYNLYWFAVMHVFIWKRVQEMRKDKSLSQAGSNCE